MNLEELKKQERPTAWFEFNTYKDGPPMRVKLEYVTLSEAQQRSADSMKTVRGMPEVDKDRMLSDIAKSIKDWQGFTLERVAEILPITVPEEKKQAEVPPTETNKIALLRDAWQFRAFVDQKTTTLSEFTRERYEDERKN